MYSSLKRWLAVGVAAAVSVIGFAPAPAAQAKTASPAAQASSWLAGYAYTVDDDYSARISVATGLALLDRAADAQKLRDTMAELSTDAAAKVAAKPGLAPNLAILARIMHLSPKDFGGTNLITAIRDNIDDTGQFGNFASAYSQAIVIIALKRSNESVPKAVVDKLLSFQDASGAFGYDAGGFVADIDSTALAIQALYLLGHHKTQIAKAAAWAKSTRAKAGYWEPIYDLGGGQTAVGSAVDSTSLMASAFKLIGKDYKTSRSWLYTQQVADGGFPAVRDDDSSNLYATYEATFLLSGKSLAKSSYSLKGYTKSPRPKVTGVLRVGETLTAVSGAWAPVPTLAYQWYRSGKKISGATSDTYVLSAADKGKHIRVRVLAHGIGLKNQYEYSKYTSVVRKALVG